jgi:hypothetical protein
LFVPFVVFFYKRVKVLLSNMGAAVRSLGIDAEALPVATAKTIQIARAHAAGKECVCKEIDCTTSPTAACTYETTR